MLCCFYLRIFHLNKACQTPILWVQSLFSGHLDRCHYHAAAVEKFLSKLDRLHNELWISTNRINAVYSVKNAEIRAEWVIWLDGITCIGC